MADIVSILLTAKDRLSSRMNTAAKSVVRFSKSSKDAFTRMTAAVGRFSTSITTTMRSALTKFSSSVTRGMAKAKKSVQDFATKAGNAFNKSKGALLAFGASIGATVVVMRSLLSAIDQEEIAMAKLVSALKNTGAGAEAAARKLSKQADALDLATSIGDTFIRQGQAMAATFGLTADQIERLTPALLDFSTATSVSGNVEVELASKTRLLGAAIGGNIRGLRTYGLALSEAELRSFDLMDSGERLNLIIDKINESMQGAAVAVGQTFAGAASALAKQFTDLKKLGGSVLQIVLRPMIDAALKLFKHFFALSRPVQLIITAFALLAGTAAALTPAVLALAVAWPLITAAMAGTIVPIAVVAAKFLIITGAIVGLVAATVILAESWGVIWESIKTITVNVLQNTLGPLLKAFAKLVLATMSFNPSKVQESWGELKNVIAEAMEDSGEALFTAMDEIKANAINRANEIQEILRGVFGAASAGGAPGGFAPADGEEGAEEEEDPAQAERDKAAADFELMREQLQLQNEQLLSQQAVTLTTRNKNRAALDAAMNKQQLQAVKARLDTQKQEHIARTKLFGAMIATGAAAAAAFFVSEQQKVGFLRAATGALRAALAAQVKELANAAAREIAIQGARAAAAAFVAGGFPGGFATAAATLAFYTVLAAAVSAAGGVAAKAIGPTGGGGGGGGAPLGFPEPVTTVGAEGPTAGAFGGGGAGLEEFAPEEISEEATVQVTIQTLGEIPEDVVQQIREDVAEAASR